MSEKKNQARTKRGENADARNLITRTSGVKSFNRLAYSFGRWWESFFNAFGLGTAAENRTAEQLKFLSDHPKEIPDWCCLATVIWKDKHEEKMRWPMECPENEIPSDIEMIIYDKDYPDRLKDYNASLKGVGHKLDKSYVNPRREIDDLIQQVPSVFDYKNTDKQQTDIYIYSRDRMSDVTISDELKSIAISFGVSNWKEMIEVHKTKKFSSVEKRRKADEALLQKYFKKYGKGANTTPTGGSIIISLHTDLMKGNVKPTEEKEIINQVSKVYINNEHSHDAAQGHTIEIHETPEVKGFIAGTKKLFGGGSLEKADYACVRNPDSFTGIRREEQIKNLNNQFNASMTKEQGFFANIPRMIRNLFPKENQNPTVITFDDKKKPILIEKDPTKVLESFNRSNLGQTTIDAIQSFIRSYINQPEVNGITPGPNNGNENQESQSPP